MKTRLTIALCLALCLILAAGCAGKRGGQTQTTETTGKTETSETTGDTETTGAAETEEATQAGEGARAAFTAYDGGVLDGTSLFTDRDLLQEADLTNAVRIEAADGQTYEITQAGVYVLIGEAADFTVRIDAPDDAKVQLVLNGVSVTNASAPVILLANADKLFVTLAAGTENTLAVTGAFADDETDADAVIFGKDDITFNGAGALTVTSQEGHGIAGNDDLVFTGGVYTITAAKHGIKAHDLIAVCGGSFTVRAGKDALHAENDDDDTEGAVYFTGATLTAAAGSDAIRATTVLQIDGGVVSVSGGEGLEATYVQLNGGETTVNATDDGVNAGRKSGAYSPTIEINGGVLDVTVGQGDTDAIDSNGDIIVTGGTVNVTAPFSSFDYDGTATYTGGTITVNGQRVDAIPQSMMPGGPGGGAPGGRR